MHPSDSVWREHGLRSAVLADDERAWQTWYEESYPGVHAYVSWRCGGRQDLTDEALQETWLTAVRRIRSFDPQRGTFAGWLRGIAANVLHNQLRRHRQHAGRLRPLNNHHGAIPAADTGREQHDRAERIAHALSALPARCEAVLQAKYLEGKSVAQIAEDWKETPKAVESLLTRARQAFREVYENDNG